MEAAEAVISEVKSQFCLKKIKIVEFTCGPGEKSPEAGKILKILN